MKVNYELASLINRTNAMIESLTGEANAIKEIKVSPRFFDLMVIESHTLPVSLEDQRNGIPARSTFRPSDAHCFRLCGVKLLPCFKVENE